MIKRNVMSILAISMAMTLWAKSNLTGSCGPTMQYQYDKTKKTLHITGVGAMNDYISKAAPWSDFKNEMRKVYIDEGVSTIGEGAFSKASKLTTVQLPNSIDTIGQSAFLGCSQLVSIKLPDSLQTIKDYAFFDTKISTIHIPAATQYIGKNILNHVDTVYFYSSWACTIDQKSFPASTNFQIRNGVVLSYYLDKSWHTYPNLNFIVKDQEIGVGRQLYYACMLTDAVNYIRYKEFACHNYKDVASYAVAMYRLGFEDQALDYLETLDSVPPVKFYLGKYYTNHKKRLSQSRPFATSYYCNFYDNYKGENPLTSNHDFTFWHGSWYSSFNKVFNKHNTEPKHLFLASLYAVAFQAGKKADKKKISWAKQAYNANYPHSSGLLGYYYSFFSKRVNNMPTAGNMAKAKQYTAEGLQQQCPLAYLSAARIALFDGDTALCLNYIDTLETHYDIVSEENGWIQYHIGELYANLDESTISEEYFKEKILYWYCKAICSCYYYAAEKLHYLSLYESFYIHFPTANFPNKLLYHNGEEITWSYYWDCLSHNQTKDEYVLAEERREIEEAQRKEQERIEQERREARMAAISSSINQLTNAITSTANAFSQSYSGSSSSSYGSSSSSSSSYSTSKSSSNSNDGTQLQQDRNVYLKWEDVLRKMKNGLTTYDESTKTQAQSAMKNIRQKWENKGQSMYHSSLEDW